MLDFCFIAQFTCVSWLRALQVSVGYFITDLAMIFWLFPSLGGMEYVGDQILHICNSLVN